MEKPTICILSDIFKLLGIDKSNTYAGYLIKNEKFGHFNKMCQNNIKNGQIGGNKLIVNYEGINFTFSKYRDDEYTMYTLNTPDDSSNCITIRINKKEKSAEILGIGYFSECFTNKQIKHFQRQYKRYSDIEINPKTNR